MAFINHREQEELLGGLRSVPLRLIPALLTTLLLYLSGDMTGLWALAWVALVPLCFACRGAGAPGAFILAVAAFLPAALLQSFWLMDVEGVSAPLVWLAAGFLPALPFFAIELPICKSIPGALRPLLLAVLAAGCWRLLPGEAQFLIPFGGLIDSELVRFTYPHVGLSLMAGLFTGLAWLAGELWYNPRRRGRTGWTGVAVAAVLAIACAADWIGASIKPRPVGVQYVTSVYVLPGNAASPTGSPGPQVGLAVWCTAAAGEVDRQNAVSKAARYAERQDANLVLMVHMPNARHAYFFARRAEPAVSHTWLAKDIEPLVIEGNKRPVIDSVGVLRIYSGLDSPEHWAARIDLELYLSVDKPVHQAQLAYWVREQRREALIRGSRQVATWDGGAAVIDGVGHVIERSDEAPIHASLPAQQLSGMPLGRARLTVLENIFAMSAPVLLMMLVLLTPVRWAKLRYRARQQSDGAVAIEEVVDDETTLSREQTETITRRFEKSD